SARGIHRAPANVDLYVAADGPTQCLQSLHERCDARVPIRIVLCKYCEDADTPHSLRLLCTRCKRPRRRRCAKKCDELAPPHCPPEARDEASYRFKPVLGKARRCPLWVKSRHSSS